MRTNYNPIAHYAGFKGPVNNLRYSSTAPKIRSVGWTLGDSCPNKCAHCYSITARRAGQNLTKEMVDRIINELRLNRIKTVNLGGNEPIFTNGLDHKKSLLPYITENLVKNKIAVGLTTSGISLLILERYYPHVLRLLNDVDISFDSPREPEHNKNRGAKIFKDALKALKLCEKRDMPRSIVMCAMNWNFTPDRITELVSLAKEHGAYIRINPIKPVEKRHMKLFLKAEQYYSGFSLLMKLCKSVEVGEPPLAVLSGKSATTGCPCGTTSFRIHSMVGGKVPVSPCPYLHDYKAGDLLTNKLKDIIKSPEFSVFRVRNKHPKLIEGCKNCEFLSSCRGGCAARSYLHNAHSGKAINFFTRDPYCPEDNNITKGPKIGKRASGNVKLVHKGYLCTWIGKPN